MKNNSIIKKRKEDHIHINSQEDVKSSNTTGLEKFRLIHQALPEINLSDVDTSISVFNKSLSLPLMISSMTGGTKKAYGINQVLANSAQKYNIAMGIGSQRIGIEEDARMETFNIRKNAPDILLFANLGAVQLNNTITIDDCKKAVDAIGADALIFHLNPLQEALMEDGDTNFFGLLNKIEQVCKNLNVPVVVKEVGWGISAKTAKRLVEAGVKAIDVAGAGGTSWSEVEKFRATDPLLKRVAGGFRAWGIPTAETIVKIREELPVILLFASGGLKSGIDIAASEIMYPIMQAYDSIMIEADVEIGGTDQKFNMLAGRDLQRKMNMPEQNVLTTPLLIGLDGKEKMSKSLDNYIGITEEPNSMFGKIMSISDEMILYYFKL
ncbi:MAG: type 2 isopentenyl-diphosphate Delta-isomerase, partial [Anaerolineales bacterium]|nr:type 2 isopentenyl-diphosphate Delta-isomerase [Anaerolineales bacterium]